MGTWADIRKHTRMFFTKQEGGFFIEVGALDGQQLSNTLWLEQELNWTGLLIEPDVYSYQALKSKHRRAWISNACLSEDNKVRETVHVTAKLRRGFVSQWQWHLLGASYQYGINRSPIFDEYLKQADQTYTKSTCFPLFSYILALNITSVDFLSLDTQGSEIDILKSLPWGQVNIRVIIVEIEDPKFAVGFTDYMTDKGYVLVDQETDYYFVRKGDPILTRV
ncbi:protein Star-like [Homarus americanus]|uniref:Star-like 12 n=1 Tax=Homarus americanus TaxID=6706 RepID=A0A8J5MJH0_HOMAM|nr:protein Star-like [Homarus americanus]KAG7153487.1 Star-like 12 [Homarus americanus]